MGMDMFVYKYGLFNGLALLAGHWAERTDSRKNLFTRGKNLPMMILSLREQTLTNITQGIRNHLMWEKEPVHPPARYRDLATRSKQQRNLPAYPKA